ncbi:MAG: AMIN domain-containing protein [Candidatus Rokubacteria bacterium]|nr:AMIN domain-containing protein [Candidatus Rokubacteria bacterium]
MRRALRVALTIVIALAASAGEGANEPVRLTDVTVSSQPDAVTVHLKTSGTVQYRATLIDSPSRLVVDLDGTTYGWRRGPLSVDTEPLTQIRGGQYKPGVARVVVELTRRVGYVVHEDVGGVAIVIPTLSGAVKTAAAGDAKPKVTPVKALPSAPEKPVAAAPTPVELERSPSSGASDAAAARTPLPPLKTPVRIAQAQAPAARPALGNGQRLISLDFKDADVVNLLRILAAESGKNIVIGEDVKGKMSISLQNVPWEQALATILEVRGLQRIDKDNVIRIVSNEQLAKEREQRARLEEAKLKSEAELRTKLAEAALKEQEAQQKKLANDAAIAEAQARGPLREETIRLAYADPEEVAKTLQGILGIPPEGVQATTTPITGGPPPIGEAPFSALYGQGAQQQPQRAPLSPSADVLSKGITIRAHKPTNSIFIRHYEKDLERIKKLIRESLDIQLPQVKIQARMEILDRDELFAIGVQWGGGGVIATDKATLVGQGFTSNQATGVGIGASGLGTLPNTNLAIDSATGAILPVSSTTGLPLGGNVVNLPISSLLQGAASAGLGGFTFGVVGSRANINLTLEALKTQRKTRTLARPEVVTVENNKATMSLGEEIPYATISSAGTQIQFKEALLKLEVTPTVVREGELTKIKMKIVVENNSRGTTAINLGSAGSPPVINKRKAETEVLIKEGDTLVIGGVTNAFSDEETRKIPLLGDIPFLGWLFKVKATEDKGTELVVFITPTTLKGETAKAAPSQTR